MIEVFDEGDLEKFDEGQLREHQIQMMLIIAIKKLESAINYHDEKCEVCKIE